ncbi:hypothetical protein [Polymorphospora rubra]|uniref:Uncharacterized protein n=1 Tax=Polymorphospora rubra TaxID=338584 RepID=A0A810MT48_9ACTN|nr:hypothetical protein [Polymorphospora rubra]BCJ64132.1 hypothetical protein Prubr_11530 [Polymorphospora rubra]
MDTTATAKIAGTQIEKAWFAISATYGRLTTPGELIHISEIRAQIAHRFDQATIDAALLWMHREIEDVWIVPQSYRRWAMTEEQRDGAVVIGDQHKELISIG